VQWKETGGFDLFTCLIEVNLQRGPSSSSGKDQERGVGSI
jgi:hypothetical protein